MSTTQLFVILTFCCLNFTGGELLEQLPTYVSSNGTDNVTCLNGGLSHPCKTLGHVLTNITKLQCTIIIVNYSHTVFSEHGGHGGIRVINITGIISLRVHGMGMPLLNFEWLGLDLVNMDTSTEVHIQNVHLVNCGYMIQHTLRHCISSHHTMHEFSLTDVILSNSTAGINVRAVNILYYSCSLNCTLEIKAPTLMSQTKFNYTFKNCSFTGRMNAHVHIRSSGSLIIDNCIFTGINTKLYAISIFLKNSNEFVNMIIQDSNIENNSFNGFLKIRESSYMKAMVQIKNNNFTTNNMIQLFLVSNNLQRSSVDHAIIVFNFNSFYNNNGTLINFKQWPTTINITNCIFSQNRASSNIISILFHDVTPVIVIKEVILMENQILTTVSANEAAIVSITGGRNVSTSLNAAFSLNQGTPLALIDTTLQVTGYINFNANSAITGGGLYINESTIYLADNDTTIRFTDNYAVYGGAVYLEATQKTCFLIFNSIHSIYIARNIARNIANVGSSIFYANNACKYACKNSIDDITSLPNIASTCISTKISIFPGQSLVHNLHVLDCFNRSTSCIADVKLLCDSHNCNLHYHMQLHNQGGLPQVVLSSGMLVTKMKLSCKVYPPPSIKPELIYTCRSPTSSTIASNFSATLTLLPCPIGFYFNDKISQCQCVPLATEVEVEQAFVCTDVGKACIRKGYWFGNVSGTVTASRCINLYCKYSTQQQPCPLHITSSDTTDYVLLSTSQDDQCQYGHGGTLCTGCTIGTTVTYGAVYCIPNYKCKPWHPYALLIVSLLCPFSFGVLLILVIQHKLHFGSGYLHGPLFYLAVLNLIPFRILGTFTKIVHYYSATFLLRLQILGFIPWCFFPSVNLLYAQYFELIAPLVVSIVLLLTVYLARCLPRLFQYLQIKSPIQGICVLIMISFWSLASTSIQVIAPIHLSGLNGTRVHLQPDLFYLHGQHIVLWIVSIMILFFLLCLIIILIFSPFVHINAFHLSLRIKPILDEFQSCYRDNIRWYSGVYFCIWIILQILTITSNYLIFHSLIIILSITHCLIQPYCQKWLNVMDGALLGCLTISSLIVYKYDDIHVDYTIKKEVIVYIFTILPLTFITLGVVWIVLIRLRVASTIITVLNTVIFNPIKKCTNFFRNYMQDHTRTTTVESLHVSQDRESLLYYLQQESADYGAT